MSQYTYLEITDNAVSPESEIRTIYKGHTHVAKGGPAILRQVKFDYLVGDDFEIVLRNSDGHLTTPITLAIVAFDNELQTEVISSDDWDATIEPNENKIICTYIPEPSSSFQIPYTFQPGAGGGEIGIAIVGTTETPEEKFKVHI